MDQNSGSAIRNAIISSVVQPDTSGIFADSSEPNCMLGMPGKAWA